jgi:hypothetical protein
VSAPLRYADLVLLALALPVFVIADLPLLGYAATAVGWLAQHFLRVGAERRAREALAAGDRRRALGAIGTSTVARLWIVTVPILVVGLVAEREDGLAAAVLAAALVTVHLVAIAVERLTGPQEGRS